MSCIGNSEQSEKEGKVRMVRSWNKTIALRIPLWSILASVLVLMVFIGALFLGQTNFRVNLMLRTLSPEDISSVCIRDPMRKTVQHNELTREDIAAVTAVVNKVQFRGKPYELNIIGGRPSGYDFTLNDGSKIHFAWQIAGNDHVYRLNDLYYICDADEEADLSVFMQLEEMYQKQCKVYFE